MSRTAARELGMKLFFEMEGQNDFSEKLRDRFFVENSLKDSELSYLKDLYTAFIANKAEIDLIVEACSENWGINRIGKVDLAVVRLSICEMFYLKDIPIPVSINEAIELGKKYSTEDSGKFINGLLGKAVRMQDEIARKNSGA